MADLRGVVADGEYVAEGKMHVDIRGCVNIHYSWGI